MAKYKLAAYKNNEYFQFPKFLLSQELSKLSNDSRVLYTVLRDRHRLSVDNNWVDNEGYIYMICSREKMGQLLNLSVPTIRKAFNLLVEHKLIEEVRQGQGKPNKVYLLLLDDTKFSKIDTSESDRETVSNVSDKSEKSFHSKDNDNFIQDCKDFSCNKNNNNNNNYNNLSINQSNNTSEKNDGLIELKTETNLNNSKDIKDLVLSEILEQGTLPYDYIFEPNKMMEAIKILTGFEGYKRNAEIDESCKFDFSIVSLFVDALTEMLTTKKSMELKGANVTYAKVYEKLIPFIDFSRAEPDIYALLESTKGDYTNACKQKTITNYLGYMKSCIWTSLQNNNIDLHAFMYRHYNG